MYNHIRNLYNAKLWRWYINAIQCLSFFPNQTNPSIFITLYHSYTSNSFGHIVNCRWGKFNIFGNHIGFSNSVLPYKSKLTKWFPGIRNIWSDNQIKSPSLLLYTMYHINKFANGTAAITLMVAILDFILFYQRVTSPHPYGFFFGMGVSNIFIQKKNKVCPLHWIYIFANNIRFWSRVTLQKSK